MHMADALISPAVGTVMLAISVGVAAYSINKTKSDLDEKKVPLMGVMGAFVFAVQMINFTIPGTGASGHLGGGILLAALLGPYAGYLTMASILLIQALFFGDGGLLAYGSNLFNLGFITCFIVYPLIYKWMTRKGVTAKRIFGASMASSVVGLQVGAFCVVLETLFSGKTQLPFGTFLLLMQPIHLAIGIVEGLVSAAVITFVWKARPEIIEKTAVGEAIGKSVSIKKVVIRLIVAAALVGGALSLFASTNPDGLEWSVKKVAGEELTASGELQDVLAEIQDKTSILPDYGFRSDAQADGMQSDAQVSVGTSVSGIVGAVLTLALAACTGLIINVYKKKKKKAVSA